MNTRWVIEYLRNRGVYNLPMSLYEKGREEDYFTDCGFNQVRDRDGRIWLIKNGQLRPVCLDLDGELLLDAA